MLGIQIGNEFLDLPPGTTIDLEQESPFLQFDKLDMIGEYSYPFPVVNNEKTQRLLNYVGTIQQKINSAGVDAILSQNTFQVGAGKVKVENVDHNLNHVSKASISCYYLSGSAGFWQDAKGKNLRDIDVGGDRSFPWQGLSIITDGFWKHIHQVANGAVGAYDYAFYPVINKGWPIEGEYPQLMNKVYFDASQAFVVRFPNVYAELDVRERNRIVPFPYLKYVLTKAFDHVGWQLKGDILEDPDFIKITMINFRAIDWCFVKVTGGVASETPRNPVVFNLKDNLPDITISSFVLAVIKKLGQWIDFDNSSKIATLKPLKGLTTSQPKDMTAKSSPLPKKTVLQEKPIYALRNNFFTGNGGAPDFKVVQLQGDVHKVTDLPAAAEARYAHVYLVIEENNYYVCQQDEDDNWVWLLYANNIYDYEPAGFNNEIITDATEVGNEYYDDYLDFIPRIDNQGEWMGRTEEPASWGIHLCFFYGLRDNKAGDPLPFASHHIYDSNGFTLSAWSLAFKAKKTDGTEVGLYDLAWKDFLTMLQSNEEIVVTLYLSFYDYLQIRFSERIVINGVELFLKKIKPSLPYKGQLVCTGIRV